MTDAVTAPTATPAPAHAPTGSRLAFVDNLRVVLMALVILHHVAVTYSGLPLWYYTEKPGSGVAALVLGLFITANQAWFMGAFFLLSGYFTPRSYDRKGARQFLRDRLLRLGLPLLVFYFVLSPIASLGSYDGGSVVAFYASSIGSGPLWFVLALLVFDMAYAAFRLATRDRAPRTAHEPTRPAYAVVFGFVLVLAASSYLLRIGMPVGFWVPVIDFPSSAYLPQYATFFALGMVAYRRGWFHAIPARMGKVGACMAMGATVVFLPLALAGGPSNITGHGTLGSLFFALWDSTFAVGMVLALLTFFRRRLDTQGRLRRYLSSHVFTVYVTHALVVTAAGYALSAVDLPTLLKFAIAAVIALPACFALAGPVRRLPGVRRVL